MDPPLATPSSSTTSPSRHSLCAPYLPLFPLCSRGRGILSRLTRCIPASFVSPLPPLSCSFPLSCHFCPWLRFDLRGQHLKPWSAVSLVFFGCHPRFTFTCTWPVITFYHVRPNYSVQVNAVLLRNILGFSNAKLVYLLDLKLNSMPALDYG